MVRHGIAVESVAEVAEVGADVCGVEVVVGGCEGGGWGWSRVVMRS
jgi:hypothetical protein